MKKTFAEQAEAVLTQTINTLLESEIETVPCDLCKGKGTRTHSVTKVHGPCGQCGGHGRITKAKDESLKRLMKVLGPEFHASDRGKAWLAKSKTPSKGIN
jgi:hypothetical protein